MEMPSWGFLIRGELALKGTTLNIPQFTMGKQICSAATKKNLGELLMQEFMFKEPLADLKILPFYRALYHLE